MIDINEDEIFRRTAGHTIFRRTAGHTIFDYKRNKEILEVLKLEPVDEKLRRFNSNWA